MNPYLKMTNGNYVLTLGVKIKSFRQRSEQREVWELNFSLVQLSSRQHELISNRQRVTRTHTPFTFPAHTARASRGENSLSELLPLSHFPSQLSCLPDQLSATKTSNRYEVSEVNRIALTTVSARGLRLWDTRLNSAKNKLHVRKLFTVCTFLT